MGVVISRFRTKPSTVEVLEGIDKDIQACEECQELYQKQLKLWVWRLLQYSSLLYLMASIIVYLWYLPEQMIGKVILVLPFVVFPLFVWLLRKGLRTLFKRRTEKNNEKLEDLKSQKRKMLLEVMETETYKTAKIILERFDPDSKTKVPESIPSGTPMTPKPGQELRQRHVTPRPPVAVTPAAARPLLAPGATHAGPPLHSAPGGPPERILSSEAAQQSLMKRPMTPGTPVPGVGMHPPGPPLARPVLPRDRGTMDRVIEYFVGDGPQNRFSPSRYALICQQCLTHNGMALKEEFEYVAFRCAYCYVLNPARKTRPQAPRLSEVTAEAKTPSHAPIPTSPTPVEPAPVEPAPAPEADESPATAVAEKQPTPPAEEEIQELVTLTTDTAPETEVAGTSQSLQLTPVKSDGELEVSDMEVE
ncbi:endoplasmic reticulum junction formation protein lunapark-A isoform X1 [Salvelinus sp. IW2-2015]|uniref:endoplasmic reticulum junction formation protein lunapark-A isoform X1 n=1 Tax=Salvelinus sp. IW2-2015 TaxID=2691554 RepID=UPI000CDFA196|nr:endoplasmic reticulum junction formation protein lunapark-A isoform X1 [Salvelinus alpinus]XP_023859392.1 endoplasmic reticulum junction formation protein lunapark-A isoform X1 [Salvelinus alpinus]XP_023859399.1 endoplasmic reticulum junction formation protein lunapark-A isoform X1 [Salvelinus alpinus]XP_023859403.1 endoplasmic reticulum junction formation protein lunapark-A isoform X1 [Salvelinus alpinus]XP_023859412.1 endoplasmic reticulum junction formation protein lunapark-A isoform X1 [